MRLSRENLVSSLCFFKCNLYRYAADVLVEALKHAGGSITLSSVTNLAAFLLGGAE